MTPTSKWKLLSDNVGVGLTVTYSAVNEEEIVVVEELGVEEYDIVVVVEVLWFEVEVDVKVGVLYKRLVSVHKLAWLNISICVWSTQM